MKYILLFCLSLMSVSCAHQAAIPLLTTRFETPEVVGKTWSGGVQFDNSPYLYATYISDLSVYPPATSGNTVGREVPSSLYNNASVVPGDELTPFRTTISMSFIEQLQVSLGTGFGGGVPMLRAKYQFLGAPVLARKNNWVASVSLGHWQFNDTESFDLGPSASGVEWDQQTYFYEVALNFGYRFNGFITYLNSYYTHVSSDTTVKVTSQPDIKYNIHGEHFGSILGVRYDFWFGLFLGAELAYNNIHLNSVPNRELGTGGVQIGYNWGQGKYKKKTKKKAKKKDFVSARPR